VEHGWSRAALNIHIETRLLEREGKAVTNFAERLPAPNTDLARQTLKDPYLFDFLNVSREADERGIKAALVPSGEPERRLQEPAPSGSGVPTHR
jgi:predicted nuclease of restriction endonuclease-like (RecB) superfamily